MSIKTQLLKLLPIFAQNIVISFYGYNLLKQRYNKDYYQYRETLLTINNQALDDLKNEQNILLDEFIHFAVANSQFYKDLYKNVDLSQSISVQSLTNFPIVTKEMLRENLADVYTIDKGDGITAFTGGTTGKSLQVLFTKEDFQKRMAYLDAFKLKLGIDPFLSKKATFSGREFTRGWATSLSNVFWRNNWAYKQRLYSTFDMTERNLPAYIANLKVYKPAVLNGFVSAIYQLAMFIKQQKTTLNFQPKAIFTTSETLLPFHRDLIEDVFKCPIYNQYASAEGAPFVTECSSGNLHYNIDTGVIEILETETGDEMLVTSFTTHGTPLIRYRIGDVIKFKSGVCTCGSGHPLVESIDGRKVESLLSNQYGHVTLSHLADVIKGLPNCIKAVQFQQYKLNEIITLLNVDRQLFDKQAEKKIKAALQHRFGTETNFKFNIVDEIQREKSGKYALIKNFLSAEDKGKQH